MEKLGDPHDQGGRYKESSCRIMIVSQSVSGQDGEVWPLADFEYAYAEFFNLGSLA